MKVIDEILNEWSFRCHDGIVDLNDLKKVKILFEILEEDIDDDILNTLINTDDDNKTKVLKQLQRIGKEEDKDDETLENKITKDIEAKNLVGGLADLIILYAKQSKDLQALSNYLDSPTVDYNDLLSNNNLYSLFEPIKISDTYKNKIINLDGTTGNVGLGKGEIALIIFLKKAKKYKSDKTSSDKTSKGDISIDGHTLEVKKGKSIIASSRYINRVTKTNIFTKEKSKAFISKYNIQLVKGIRWIIQILDANPTKEEVEEVLSEIYPELDIDIDISSPITLNNNIGLALAKDYLSNKSLLFINDKNEYVCVEDYNAFEKAIKNGSISFNMASDIIPRTEYIGITNQNPTEEKSLDEDYYD